MKLLIAAGAAWVLAVAIGLHILWTYKITPGGAADPPRAWPVQSRMARSPDKATLCPLGAL